MSADGPVLIAFDGSPDARDAISFAGPLLSGRDAVVVSVWEPLLLQASALALSAIVDPDAVARDDEEIESATRTLATEGAELARAAGFGSAEPRWQRGTGRIADAIIDVAAEAGASLIVTGTRGLGGVKSLLAGSVSDRLLHHARRPVLIVPRAS